MSDQLSTNLAALKIDRSVGRPPGAGRVWKNLLLFAVLAGGLGAAYAYGKPVLEAKVFKTEVEFTEVALVSPAQASIELTSTGYLVPQTVSKVAAKVGGRVAKIHVRQGSEVKAGDLLIEIDPSDHAASMAAAQSQTFAARARVGAARASLREVEIQASRAQTLAAQGVSPQSNADDLNARALAMLEQVRAAEADVKAAGAQVAALRVGLDNYTIRAPISGKVLNKPPEVGEYVGPQPAGVSVDMGGVEIANLETLMVETDVPEQRLGLVKLGSPCEIVLDAYPTRRYRGRAAEITPKVDRAKATVMVKVAFTDDKEGALPEMSARVSFLSAEVDASAIKAPPKLIVPGSALATVNGARVVFVVDNGKVQLTPVSLGPAFGSGFELTRGPGAGTRLVKDPPETLVDGQSVKERTPS
jgi:RND family efflux transporter MFP subunit